jgi:hypothetical protein
MKGASPCLWAGLATLALVATTKDGAASPWDIQEFHCRFQGGVASGVAMASPRWEAHYAINDEIRFKFFAYSAEALRRAQGAMQTAGEQKEAAQAAALMKAAEATGYAGLLTGDDPNDYGIVAVTPSRDGVTFAETTTSGNVQTTSILTQFKAADGRYLAVHSRHTLSGRATSISQYLGTCAGRLQSLARQESTDGLEPEGLPPPATGSRPLDREMIQAGWDRLKGPLEVCHRQVRRRGTEMVAVRVVVSGDGTVSSVKVIGMDGTEQGATTLPSRCLLQTIRAGKFPRSSKGGSFTRTFTLGKT